MPLDTSTPLAINKTVAPATFTHQDTSPRRTVAAVGLLGIALIHAIDLPGKMEETPSMGVAFIGLILASLLLAGALVVRPHRLVWLATGGLAAAVIVGYVINRSVGLPGAMGDIGNWWEPLGTASLFVEGLVVLVALPALRRG
jgi:hypothetical protein